MVERYNILKIVKFYENYLIYEIITELGIFQEESIGYRKDLSFIRSLVEDHRPKLFRIHQLIKGFLMFH